MHILTDMKIDLFKISLIFGIFWLIVSSMCFSAAGKEFVVVIDAGHGGHDPGAIGKFSREKNINLSVALQVGKMIQNNCKDVKVIYTRNKDVFIPLDRRAAIANNAKADLFISIHTNSLPKGRIVRGAETFTLGLARSEANLEIAKRENSVILIENDYQQRYAGFNPNSSESYIMFEFIQDKHMEQSIKLAKLVQKHIGGHAKRIDRGVHQAGFLVLRATTMPSILIELGYISTPDEEKYLNSKEGVTALGNSIYKAFLAYKKEHASPLKEDNSYIYTDAGKTNTPSKNQSKQVTKKIEVLAANTTNPPVLPAESAVTESRPVFKIQILTSGKPLKKTDKRFKGLSPIDYYKESGIYKYTYAASNDYNKILRIKKSINPKFKDSFIIAFVDGTKVDVRKAIATFKSGKNH